MYLLILRRTPVVTCARAPCRRNPARREDRIRQATKFGGFNYSGLQSSQWRIAIASSMFGSGTGFGHSMDAKFFVQEQHCARCDKQFVAILTSWSRTSGEKQNDAIETKRDFWNISGSFSYRHVTKKNDFLFHWNTLNNDWSVDGERPPAGSWTKFTIMKKKKKPLLEGHMLAGERLTKI